MSPAATSGNGPYALLLHPEYGQATTRRIFQPGVEIPLSLAYLSAYIEREGCDNDILDLRLENDPRARLVQHVAQRRPLVVGLTASTANIEHAAHAAAAVKTVDPTIVTAVGGWHASAQPEETLRRFPQFDYAVHGEGEVVLTNLIRAVYDARSPRELNGLTYRDDGGITVNPREELIADLDTIPFPALHKLPAARYHAAPATRNYRRLPSTGILVGRGCPYRCRFCYKGVWGHSVRTRSPENVLAEIEYCMDRFGISDFRFYDDTLTSPQWDVAAFCQAIIDRRLDITWNCWSRVNDVHEDKLRLMKAAGCYHVKFGIEFGTQKALTLARKGATLRHAREAVAACRKVGIECKGSFIFGIPGETVDDCRQTLRFALHVAPDFATFYPFDPIPGSPFHDQIVAGQIDPRRDVLPNRVARGMASRAYRAFYLRPQFLAQRLRSLVVEPKREFAMLFDGAKMVVAHGARSLFASPAVTASAPVAKPLSRAEETAIRVVDVVVSLVAIVLSSPIMLLIGLLIRLDSRGPVIFRQQRVGRDRRRRRGADNGNPLERRGHDLGGRPFTFCKFRTMRHDARRRWPELYRYEYDENQIRTLCFKIPCDPRLTSFGRWLRRTTLDELPNFVNVIRGDMSLVGPRPEIPEMVRYYTPAQRVKFSVKPGITGLAQVNGRGLLSFQDTIAKDVEYVRRRSLRANLAVLLKTARVTFFRIGAF